MMTNPVTNKKIHKSGKNKKALKVLTLRAFYGSGGRGCIDT